MKHSLPFFRIRRQILEVCIIRAVPFLNLFRRSSPWLYSITHLREFPTKSWGNEVALFLDRRGFTDFLPQYEVHDAFHTLLDYDTTVIGEMRLQAFMIGNHSASFAGTVLFWLGCALLPELWSQLRYDILRGLCSDTIAAWNVTELLERDIYQVRAALGHQVTTLIIE